MNKTIRCFIMLGVLIFWSAGCTTPASIEVTPNNVVFEKAGSTLMLYARVLDQDGNQMSIKGMDIIWSCEDTKNVRVTSDGQVTAVASGETEVQVSIADTEVTAKVPVRVKLASSIRISHEKIRLWTDQIREDVWAEVLSEKGAFVEGFLPKWSSRDESVARAEPIVDPKRRQSWVKITGIKPGTARIEASFRGITKDIRVAVFSKDEEVNMVGEHISKKKEKDAKKARAKKKKKRGRRIDF
ncbi:MAG: hypothetical protein GY847_18350 [Proteobacteria bacterium]|nr:hypothetical protein [Pseudomonadota bacterium]